MVARFPWPGKQPNILCVALGQEHDLIKSKRLEKGLPVSVGSFLHHVRLLAGLHLLWVAQVKHVELHVDGDGGLTPDVPQLARVGYDNFLKREQINTAKIEEHLKEIEAFSKDVLSKG